MSAQATIPLQRSAPIFGKGRLIVGMICLGLRPSVGVAAEATQKNPPAPTASVTSEVSDVQGNALAQSVLQREWEHDAALGVKASFTVQRRPLNEFLNQLHQQTGVGIKLPENSPLHLKRLTATGTDMPLTEVLSCLSRLYAINWQKLPDGSYVAAELKLNDVERELMKFGDLDSWRTPEASMSGEKRRSLALAIVEHTDGALLKSPAGQPLAEMPADLQTRLRKEIEQHAALNLIATYAKASIFNFSDSLFRIQQPPPSKPDPRVALPGFTTPTPNQNLKNAEPPFNVALVDTKGVMVAPLATINNPR